MTQGIHNYLISLYHTNKEDNGCIDSRSYGHWPSPKDEIQLCKKLLYIIPGLSCREYFFEVNFNNIVIHTDQKLSSSIETLTGITQDMVSKAPPLEKVLREFGDFVSFAAVRFGKFEGGFFELVWREFVFLGLSDTDAFRVLSFELGNFLH